MWFSHGLFELLPIVHVLPVHSSEHWRPCFIVLNRFCSSVSAGRPQSREPAAAAAKGASLAPAGEDGKTGGASEGVRKRSCPSVFLVVPARAVLGSICVLWHFVRVSRDRFACSCAYSGSPWIASRRFRQRRSAPQVSALRDSLSFSAAELALSRTDVDPVASLRFEHSQQVRFAPQLNRLDCAQFCFVAFG